MACWEGARIDAMAAIINNNHTLISYYSHACLAHGPAAHDCPTIRRLSSADRRGGLSVDRRALFPMKREAEVADSRRRRRRLGRRILAGGDYHWGVGRVSAKWPLLAFYTVGRDG